jgi:hypothetical protein
MKIFYKIRLIIIIISTIFSVVIITGSGCRQSEIEKTTQEIYKSPFIQWESQMNEHINEYIDIHSSNISPSGGYIRGKIITIDIENRKIDNFWLHLPTDMIAASPDEVGTIIWLKWDQSIVGRYTNGKNAYQISCLVTIIDKLLGTKVDEKKFWGSPPPSKVISTNTGVGSRPNSEIAEYIESLPRK